MTTVKKSPRPEVRVVDPVEVNLVWLLRHISDANEWTFAIARHEKEARSHLFLYLLLASTHFECAVPHAAPQRAGG